MNIKDKMIILSFFNSLMNDYNFKVYVENSKEDEKIFKLNDLQGGNLGNIESEEFDNLASIIERLEIYHNDYITNYLEERIMQGEVIEKYDLTVLEELFINNNYILKVLHEITPEWYLNLIDYAKSLNSKEIVEVIENEEKFYKEVCQKYINSNSNEMLIEKNGDILHITIEDKYIELKEEGLINDKNYKNYLNKNYGTYIYSYYKELFESEILHEIKNDMLSCEFVDDDGKWTYCLPFEMLKKLELGYVVTDSFPFIRDEGVAEKYIKDFYQHFTLEQLNNFEHTLYLYHNTNEIKYDSEKGFLSSESYDFNQDILRLSCGLTIYEDFIKDYIGNDVEDIKEQDIKIYVEAYQYFKENNLNDLMGYGNDYDEGLYSLSELYKDLMDELNIKYKNVYTEDISAGKYKTIIEFENSSISVDTSAWNDYEVVADNLSVIYEECKILYHKQEIENKKTIYDGYWQEEKYRKELIETINKTEYNNLKEICINLGFALSPYDLIRMAETYKSADKDFKEKIEYILEDLNFHFENGLLINGKADEVIIKNKKEIENYLKNEITEIFRKEYLKDPENKGMLPMNSEKLNNRSPIELFYLVDEGILQKRDCEGLAFEFTDEYINNNFELEKEELEM